MPDEAITRQEIALLLSNAVTSLGREPQRADKIKRFPFPIGILQLHGRKTHWIWLLMLASRKGDDSNCIRPGDCASRAESAVMLKRFLEAFVWSGPPSGQEWEIAFADEFEVLFGLEHLEKPKMVRPVIFYLPDGKRMLRWRMDYSN